MAEWVAVIYCNVPMNWQHSNPEGHREETAEPHGDQAVTKIGTILPAIFSMQVCFLFVGLEMAPPGS